MPEIAVDADCSASRARRCATDKPKGDGDRRSPGDTEHARAAATPCEYAALGARLVVGEELPSERPP